VAKRAGSAYRSGKRCGDWLKWWANRSQEFAIGGYVPNGEMVDSILVEYRDLMYSGRIRAAIPAEFRRVLRLRFEELEFARCPFHNLPDRTEGRWGEGLTLAKMAICRWLDPFVLAESSFWMDPGRSAPPSSFRWNPQRQGCPRFSWGPRRCGSVGNCG
jgi:bifunctional non-homologous end joining protein LigD